MKRIMIVGLLLIISTTPAQAIYADGYGVYQDVSYSHGIDPEIWWTNHSVTAYVNLRGEYYCWWKEGQYYMYVMEYSVGGGTDYLCGCGYDYTWDCTYKTLACGRVNHLIADPVYDSKFYIIMYNNPPGTPVGYQCGAVTKTLTATFHGGARTLSGNTGCLDSVTLYGWGDGNYTEIETQGLVFESDSYAFGIGNYVQYKLVFSDTHEYIFTCDGNEVYNYGACPSYILNLLDNCANPLIDPHTTIFRNMTEIVYEGDDNPVALVIGTDVEEDDYLQIIIDTKDMAVQYNDYVSEISKSMYHPTIDWNLDVHVVDDTTGSNIESAKVTKSQTCSIIEPDTGYALTQADGRVTFTGLANSNIGLTVEKSGYNTFDGSFNVGSAFNCWSEGGGVTVYLNATTGNSTDDWNNGTHNDSEANGTGEETLPDDHEWGCGVYFKNTDGYITSTIKDTDAYVDMYWWVKGCDATLKFQSQIYTYWYTDVEYQVSNNSFEYRRILNDNFSDHTQAYRGFIYNNTCECNDIQILKVTNESYEQETHYENLTSHCWIYNKLSGNEIDYRSDVKCVIYANSTNSTLLDITANFMNGSTLVDSTILNWADFVTGSPKWYYVWYPDYEYTSGYNYTLNITGFDGYQLDTDEVWTADIIGNTLTVNVKDNHGASISYSTVFIENWGSIATGIYPYASVTGLPDGNIQYKATKSGYISSGWDTITLSGADESVTCILIATESTSVIGQKMSDKDIKSIFIPLMYILFIFMILGAFKYAME